MNLEPTYNSDGSLASVEIVATPDEVAYGTAAGAWGKTPPYVGSNYPIQSGAAPRVGPIERSGKSLFAPLFCEHTHDIADPEHGGTGNCLKCGVPITYDGPSQTFQAIIHDGPIIAHHDMAAAELRVLARMSELPPDMAGEVVRILPVPAAEMHARAEYAAFAAAAPSFSPANGDTWPQFRRRVQVTVAAKNGGMTDAEAKELGQWDHDNAPDPATLKAHFLAVIRARCIVPSGRVAKRYRARGRW